MVSVKRFIHDEPALFKASKAFVAQFFRCVDPIVYVASKLPNANARIAWTLLGSALFQDRTYPDILRLLAKLYERFPGDKLWTLPVPKGSEIEDVVEQTFNSRNWSVFEHVAGIFWSVGLFVRRHPDLVAWVREHSPEELWNDLGDIYFMGRSNPRPKACAAIYRLIAPAPLGLGLECRGSSNNTGSSNGKGVPKMPPLPLTMGARRFLAMLGPAKESNFSTGNNTSGTDGSTGSLTRLAGNALTHREEIAEELLSVVRAVNQVVLAIENNILEVLTARFNLGE